jgi:hypothetical protein
MSNLSHLISKGLVLAAVFLVSISAVSAQERFVKPVDEAKKDATFLAFRDRLIKAVDARDSKFIFSILDPKIQLSFGGDFGVRDFKKYWKLEAKNSEFWPTFSTVIKNGGRFDTQQKRPKLFTAPYLFMEWPDDVDVFEYSAIFGNNVNLRAKPSMAGGVIAQLSYNIVSVDMDRSAKRTGSDDIEWFYVKTLGGKTGYVKSEFVRSSIDMRAGFEKIRGKWTMTFFIGGD